MSATPQMIVNPQLVSSIPNAKKFLVTYFSGLKTEIKKPAYKPLFAYITTKISESVGSGGSMGMPPPISALFTAVISSMSASINESFIDTFLANLITNITNISDLNTLGVAVTIILTLQDTKDKASTQLQGMVTITQPGSIVPKNTADLLADLLLAPRAAALATVPAGPAVPVVPGAIEKWDTNKSYEVGATVIDLDNKKYTKIALGPGQPRWTAKVWKATGGYRKSRKGKSHKATRKPKRH